MFVTQNVTHSSNICNAYDSSFKVFIPSNLTYDLFFIGVILMSMLLHSNPTSMRKISSLPITKTKTCRRADNRRQVRAITTSAQASIPPACRSYFRGSKIRVRAAQPRCSKHISKRSHSIRTICISSSSKRVSNIIRNKRTSRCRRVSPCHRSSTHFRRIKEA